jgi:GTP 3',8-cyclase
MQLPVLQLPPAHGRSAGHAAFQPHRRSIAAVRVLRISLTDRCNLRCLYCMPAEGLPWLPIDRLLPADQIVEIARAAAEILGISRIKLTGGEPTVRPDLVDLVRALRRIGAIGDISLTTNGVLLEKLAAPLLDAGLDRVTVSLDSLNPQRFRRVTRNGDIAAVLRGLDAAMALGYQNTKLNCVVMRGINEDEVADFARLTIHYPLAIRFIEYMPMGDAEVLHQDGPEGGCGGRYRGKRTLVTEAEIRDRIESELGPLLPIDRPEERGVGPAVMYRLACRNPVGRIGFISAMSAPFCDTCNRLRLTATGQLRSCLFDAGEVDLVPILRALGDPVVRRTRIAQAMARCVQLKPDLHSPRGQDQMSRIGG